MANLLKDASKKIFVGIHNDVYLKGYDEAADICVSHITRSIDKLKRRMRNDNKLSEKEQFLMITLEDLRDEIEDALKEITCL